MNLLQIGIVSPGTHLVKNHESQSMPASTNKSHFKKQWVVHWKICFCLYVKIQTVNLKTLSPKRETVLHVQYTEIYLESLYFNAQQRLLKWSLVNNSHNIYHRNHMNRIFYKNTSSDRSTDLWFNYFAFWGIFMRQGRTRMHRYKIFNVFVTKISPFYEQQQKKDICTVWLNCSKL